MPQKNVATVEQDNPSKVPVLTAGDITPSVMQVFEDGCNSYFDNKDIVEDKQVRKVLGGLKDSHIKDWISSDQAHIQALKFIDFMIEFQAAYLHNDWEDDTCCELLNMSQGDASFRKYVIGVQAKNSLLYGTPSHFTNDKLCHQLKVGMSTHLADKCHAAKDKLSKITELRKWIVEVKHLDDELCAELRCFQDITFNHREADHHTHANTDPSCLSHPNNAQSTSSSSHNNAYNTQNGASNNNNNENSNTCRCAPPITSDERTLLRDNQGCLKCHCFFISRVAASCPNDYLNPVTYHTLTQADIDHVKNHHNVTKPVAAVSMSAFIANEEQDSGPIAAVLGSNKFPGPYLSSSRSSVLEGSNSDSGSDEVSIHLSDPPIVATIASKPQLTPTAPTAMPSDMAPLCVLHITWWCAANGPAHSSPITFNALIDDGSHTVLIHNNYVDKLGLACRKLAIPECVELAMQSNGKKMSIELYEYVKLHLHDPVSSWSARSVHAIVTPRLCAPVILGLPFLSHNHIIIDHHERTVINKETGINLLNLRPPPLPPPPKPKVWEVFEELQANHALMLIELKKVCLARLVKNDVLIEQLLDTEIELNIVAAILNCMEELVHLQKLKLLGTESMAEYKDVFVPIPHIDELPTDVYCRIKLKDASQNIQTRSYSTPCKYRQAWQTLIQQHLDAETAHSLHLYDAASNSE